MAILKEWSDAATRHAEVRRVLDLRRAGRRRAPSGSARCPADSAAASCSPRPCSGDPDLLVLDEPTAGLDPAQRGRLRDVLGRAGETATVLISTHQTEDVAALCERVVVLDGGRVLFDGTVTDLVGQAAGRVWMAAERDPAAQHAWRTGTGRVRHVGDPPPDAELIEPALEDAYLLLVGDAGPGPRTGGRVMSTAAIWLPRASRADRARRGLADAPGPGPRRRPSLRPAPAVPVRRAWSCWCAMVDAAGPAAAVAAPTRWSPR